MWNVTKGFLKIQIYHVICCALSNPVSTPLCKFFSPKMQQTKTVRKLLKAQLIALYLQTTVYVGHALCWKVTLQTLYFAFTLTIPTNTSDDSNSNNNNNNSVLLIYCLTASKLFNNSRKALFATVVQLNTYKCIQMLNWLAT